MQTKHTKENIENDKPIGELGGSERGKMKAEILAEREADGLVAPEPPPEKW